MKIVLGFVAQLFTIFILGVGNIAAYELPLPEKSAEFHFRSCNSGIAESCFLLGVIHFRGLGTERNSQKAFELYTLACDRDFAEACSELGRLYENGFVVNQDKEKGIRLYAKACMLGHPRFCQVAGKSFLHGRHVEKDVTKSTRLLESGCKNGFFGACLEAGDAYINGLGVNKNPTIAAEFYELACEAEDKDACSRLGNILYWGIDGKRHVERAKHAFKRACDIGGKKFCRNAGPRVDVKSENAAAHLEQACYDGFLYKCGSLGALSLIGTGSFKKDVNKAVRVLQRGCEGGESGSCLSLAGVYHRGKHTKIDYKKAIKWYEKACALRNKLGCQRKEQVINASTRKINETPEPAEIVGYWKMLVWPNKAVNKSHPYSVEHQYFAFYADGKYLSIISPEEIKVTPETFDKMRISNIEKIATYKLTENTLFISHSDNVTQEFFNVSLFKEKKSKPSFNFEKGDLLLSAVDVKNGGLIVRWLRRIKS